MLNIFFFSVWDLDSVCLVSLYLQSQNSVPIYLHDWQATTNENEIEVFCIFEKAIADSNTY